jgi:hypothetical protein
VANIEFSNACRVINIWSKVRCEDRCHDLRARGTEIGALVDQFIKFVDEFSRNSYAKLLSP